MNPIYFKTQFRSNLEQSNLPVNFSIITAYAPTGEAWIEEQNTKANKLLKNKLSNLGIFIGEIDGYNPDTGHSEKGFVAEIGWQEACDIGVEFKQDAIYFVSGEELFVTYCDDRRELMGVSSFFDRLSHD